MKSKALSNGTSYWGTILCDIIMTSTVPYADIVYQSSLPEAKHALASHYPNIHSQFVVDILREAIEKYVSFSIKDPYVLSRYVLRTPFHQNAVLGPKLVVSFATIMNRSVSAAAHPSGTL